MDTVYTFTLTEQDLGVIARGLMEMPYKNAAPVIDKLNQQINEQQSPPPEPEPEEPEPTEPTEGGE